MVLHNITEFYTEWFSFCPYITSKFRTIVIFKSFAKQNNDSNETCRNVHDILLSHTSLVYVQRFMSSLHKTYVNFHSSCPPLSHIWFLTKMILINAVHLSAYGPTLTSASFASTSDV
jgi:hypothetical protein